MKTSDKKIPLALLSSLVTLTPAMAKQVHTVEEGDTFSKVIKDYVEDNGRVDYSYVFQQALVLNQQHIPNADLIVPGSVIYLPELEYFEPTVKVHEVSPGESLSIIAGEYFGENGIYKKESGSLECLLKYNPQILNKNKIVVGQKLIIPTERQLSAFRGGLDEPFSFKSSSEVQIGYTVKRGDTFSKIAQRIFGSLYTHRGEENAVNYLLSLNPQLVNPNILEIGDRLNLPTAAQIAQFKSSAGPLPKRPKRSIASYRPKKKTVRKYKLNTESMVELERTYTVRAGDTLVSIAERISDYGEKLPLETTIELIKQLNTEIPTNNRLFVGQKIQLPRSDVFSRSLEGLQIRMPASSGGIEPLINED